MKLIHTADIHLDRCFAALAADAGRWLPDDYGSRRRASLRAVFHGVLARAKEWQADAVLVAGDLFEQERVTSNTVSFLQKEFEEVAPIPVFIAPGEADAVTGNGVYATVRWPKNVYIFTSPRWQAQELGNTQITVHGRAVTAGVGGPMPPLELQDDGRIHVAVAHGSEEGTTTADELNVAPFKAESLAHPPLVYLALGHCHAMQALATKKDDDTPEVRACYAGAPEGFGFGDVGPHYYLEVEGDRHGVVVTPVASARASHATHEVDCAGIGSPDELAATLRQLASQQEAQVAHVLLKGPRGPWHDAVPAVHKKVSDAFELLLLLDQTRPQVDYTAEARRPTTKGLFMKRVLSELRDATSPERRAMLERALDLGWTAYENPGAAAAKCGGPAL